MGFFVCCAILCFASRFKICEGAVISAPSFGYFCKFFDKVFYFDLSDYLQVVIVIHFPITSGAKLCFTSALKSVLFLTGMISAVSYSRIIL